MIHFLQILLLFQGLMNVKKFNTLTRLQGDIRATDASGKCRTPSRYVSISGSKIPIHLRAIEYCVAELLGHDLSNLNLE